MTSMNQAPLMACMRFGAKRLWHLHATVVFPAMLILVASAAAVHATR